MIAKVLVRVRFGDRRDDALAWMTAREAEHALDQPNRPDAPGRECRVGPLFDGGPDALALADEAIDKRLLTGRGLGLAGARRKHARGHARVHHHERVHVEDAHEVRIPLHAEALTEQDERHRVERATHFDMPVGVDGPLTGGEERKRGAGEGLQRPLLDLDEVRPHLAARRAVNPQAGNGAIPLPEKGILRVEAVKLPALQRVVFTYPPLRSCLPFCSGLRGCVGNGVKPQCCAKAR